MSAGYSPETERFDRDNVGQPLLDAVQELCRLTGKTLDDIERLSLHEVSLLADEVYGDKLTPFWRNWKDWHADDEVQPMGDLDRRD